MLPWFEPELGRKPQAEQSKGRGKGKERDDDRSRSDATPTMLDQFVKTSAKEGSPDEDDEDGPQMTVVTNADGTMSVVPAEAPS